MTIQPIYCLLEKGDFKHHDTSEPSSIEGKQDETGEGLLVKEGDVKAQQKIVTTEKSCFESLAFIVRRLSIPYAIVMASTLFPNVNSILSLIGGDICGVMLLILPVLFYKAAYVVRPSKKSRTLHMLVGYTLMAITIPIGMMGLYQNMTKLMGPEQVHAE